MDSRKEKNDKKNNRPSVFYFTLHMLTKNIDPTITIVNKHADLFMEKKIRSFVDYFWKKKCSGYSGNHNQPKSYPVEPYSMIPSLSSQATGEQTKLLFKYALYCIAAVLPQRNFHNYSP